MLKSPLTSHLQSVESLVANSCHSVVPSLEPLGAYTLSIPRSPLGRRLSLIQKALLWRIVPWPDTSGVNFL